MARPFCLSFVILAGAALLAPSLSAQMRGGGFGGGSGGGSIGGSIGGGGGSNRCAIGGGRSNGTPTTPSPVNQPALAGQPLFDNSLTKPSKPGPSSSGCMGNPAAGPAPDPMTMGKKAEGKELKAAVKKVTALKWNASLADARTQAAASGKPILWLQALGEIDGFA